MIHSFDTEVAKEVGILEAVLLNNIYYWIIKNKANGKHFHDGKYWTYNSIKAFKEMFPYATERKIRTALGHLVEKEILVTGNYNQSTYDRTLWYALTEQGISFLQKCQMHFAEMSNGDNENDKSILTECQMDLPEMSNRNGENVEPIPNNNTYNKPNEKTDRKQYNVQNEDFAQNVPDKNSKNQLRKQEANELFERVWKMYPNKRGKGAVSESAKLKLLKVGEEQLKRAIGRYLNEWASEKEWRKQQNGSTFFNKGYIDYLDENYKQDEGVNNDGQAREENTGVAEPDDPFFQEFLRGVQSGEIDMSDMQGFGMGVRQDD